MVKSSAIRLRVTFCVRIPENFFRLPVGKFVSRFQTSPVFRHSLYLFSVWGCGSSVLFHTRLSDLVDQHGYQCGTQVKAAYLWLFITMCIASIRHYLEVDLLEQEGPVFKLRTLSSGFKPGCSTIEPY